MSGLLNAPKISNKYILLEKLFHSEFFVVLHGELPNLAFPGIILRLSSKNMEIFKFENLITPKLGLLNAHSKTIFKCKIVNFE